MAACGRLPLLLVTPASVLLKDVCHLCSCPKAVSGGERPRFQRLLSVGYPTFTEACQPNSFAGTKKAVTAWWAERLSSRDTLRECHHEKDPNPRSRLRTIRLGCFCPDSARRRAIGPGLREQGRGQRHVRDPVEPDRTSQAGGR